MIISSAVSGEDSLEGEAERVCASCTLCCRLPEIDEFEKPANQPCRNCTGTGCAIYETRPQLCRDFLCLWRRGERLGPEWNPRISHMMVYAQGPQVTVLVDPAMPDAWRNEPFHGQLKDWAGDIAEAGGYIIVFSGDDLFKVEPCEPASDAHAVRRTAG